MKQYFIFIYIFWICDFYFIARCSKWNDRETFLKTYCFRLGIHKYSCTLDTILDFIFDFSPLEFSRSMRYKSFQKLLGVQTTEAYFTFQFYVPMYTLCANVMNWLKLNCTVMCLAKFILFFFFLKSMSFKIEKKMIMNVCRESPQPHFMYNILNLIVKLLERLRVLR